MPFFILSLAFGLMSVWFQKNQALVVARLTLRSSSFMERLAGAGQDFWFYVGKIFWPVNLSVIYPAWKLDPEFVRSVSSGFAGRRGFGFVLVVSPKLGAACAVWNRLLCHQPFSGARFF